jgi:molecular chaperone GrpE (heat shock protein)
MCTRRRRRSRRTGDEGRQIEVVQKGYKLGDKVLRPARVVVAAQKIDEA